jgi:hypothetical protein
MNARLAKAIRNAEAFVLGRQYDRPLHPQPLKCKPAQTPVIPIAASAALNRSTVLCSKR